MINFTLEELNAISIDLQHILDRVTMKQTDVEIRRSVIEKIKKLIPPPPITGDYEYEMYFNEGLTTLSITGWVPISDEMIRNKEKIQHYIDIGLLRKIRK